MKFRALPAFNSFLNRFRGSRLVLCLMLGMAGALLVGGASALGLLGNVENLALDMQFRQRANRVASDKIVIVAIDDQTVASQTTYPLRRSVYAELVRRLTRAGAKTIAFDIYFPRPSPFPFDDADLARACEESGRVIHSGVFHISEARDATQSAGEEENARTLDPRFRVLDRNAQCDRSAWGSLAHPMFRRGAAALGYVNAPPERDGTLRRIPHLIRYYSQSGPSVYPSLALATIANYFGLGPNNVVARGRDIFLPAPDGVRHIMQDSVPEESGKQSWGSWINWVPPRSGLQASDNWTLNTSSFQRHSALEVLQGGYNPQDFHDRIVLIGVEAAGAFERHATPFSSVQPAVELQANAIDDILQNRPLYMTPRSLQLALLLCFPALIAFVVAPRSALHSALWTLGLCGVLWLGGVQALNHNWILPVVAPLGAGIFTAIVATGHDAIRSARGLKIAEERYALAVRGANDGLWDWNLQTDEIYYSPRWKAMVSGGEIGAAPIGVAPDEWFHRVHPDDLEKLKHDLQAHLEGASPHFENQHRMRRADGESVWMMSRGLRVCGDDGKPSRMAGSLTDISEHKNAQAQLEHNAFYDALTELPNRALFMDRLERALSRSKRREDYRFAVLFMDLDRFKVVNDSLGHIKGDRLLVEVSRCLQVCLRPGDTAARLGGDEFTILLDDIADVSDATRVAERLSEQLAKPMSIDGHEVFPTASLGIAISTPKYEQPEELLRDADAAMYRAKSLGRARYELFDEAMHARSLGLLQLETDLRRALERREFQAYFQPIVSLATNRIIGFEALARWRHPERGLVSPGEFIPLAEETGLIVPIDAQILQQACEQTRRWQEQLGRPLFASVNLSAKQFAQPGMVAHVEDTLRETGLDPKSLKLEITEGVIMNDPEAAAAMLLQLKELGIQLSVDDFGTGYSSLSYLHRFPLDTLKIDQSFVARIGPAGENSEIVRTIVTLARNLNMETIAEGVETRDQLVQLRWLRCNYGQGYLWARPLPAAEAEAMLLRESELSDGGKMGSAGETRAAHEELTLMP